MRRAYESSLTGLIKQNRSENKTVNSPAIVKVSTINAGLFLVVSILHCGVFININVSFL
jgi:hypothetical protein